MLTQHSAFVYEHFDYLLCLTKSEATCSQFDDVWINVVIAELLLEWAEVVLIDVFNCSVLLEQISLALLVEISIISLVTEFDEALAVPESRLCLYAPIVADGSYELGRKRVEECSLGVCFIELYEDCFFLAALVISQNGKEGIVRDEHWLPNEWNHLFGKGSYPFLIFWENEGERKALFHIIDPAYGFDKLLVILLEFLS